MLHRLSVLLLLAAATTLLPAPATAAVCSGNTGVTVIVQFPDGHTESGCAAGDPSDGLDALERAGFTYRFVQGQNGAVCQIDDVPAPNRCWTTSAYWSYWHAQRGGRWEWATTGASYDPAPGSVEGWRFGDGSAGPTMKPPAAPKPTPRPTPGPTPGPTPKSQQPTPKPGTQATGATTTAPDALPDATGTPKAGDPASVETAADLPATATPTATDDAVAAAPAEKPLHDADDGGLSWLWGVLVVLALAGAGAVAMVQRRARGR